MFKKVILPPLMILIVISLGLAVLYRFHLSGSSSKHSTHYQVGDVVEDYTLRSIEGSKTRLSEIKSKIIVVNFWATWCSACLIEMPSFLRLKERFSERDLSLIFVSVDDNPQEAVPELLTKFNIRFPTYYDENQELSEAFDVHGIPLTVILNNQRKILAMVTGDQEWDSDSVLQQFQNWLGTQASL